MKNRILLLFLIVSILTTSCGKDSLRYDFSKVKSKFETRALIAKMQLENKDKGIDSTSTLHNITLKGMHYAGVRIKSALITDHYTLLTTDTLNFSAKNLLEALEAEKGLTALSDTYNKNFEFEWADEIENKKLEISLINGKHLAAFGDKDYAKLTLTYNPTYEIPLAKIHNDIKTFENKPKYQLKIRANDCNYDIIINDIILTESSNETEFDLNQYITGPVSSIKVIAKYRKDINQKSFSTNAYFSATVTNTDKVLDVQEIAKINLKGSNPAVIEKDFNSTLPIYPEAWTNGADLRNDKNLKAKVIALYDKIGKAFLTKDEQAINDIFYQKDFEVQQSNFDTNFITARSKWEAYLTVQASTYKYSLSKEFDIEFNAGGKLIYTFAKDKSDMIIITGKKYDETLNYYLYQPKGSNELKIIR